MGTGTWEEAEHGLGAGRSTGRPLRVRPLLRVEVLYICRRLPHQSADWFAMTANIGANQGGTASIFVALGFPRAIFHF